MIRKYGLIKPSLDAHSLGLQSVASLLSDCGANVVIADPQTSRALANYKHEPSLEKVVDWLQEHKINCLGLSYRLDPVDAAEMVGRTVNILKEKNLLKYQGGKIELVFFGGLPEACHLIDKEQKGLVETFPGGEQDYEVLLRLKIDKEDIPMHIVEGNVYDQTLLNFAEDIIRKGNYHDQQPTHVKAYPEFGTDKDHLSLRLNNVANQEPLIRSHIGPYDPNLSQRESIDLYKAWLGEIATAGYLDILSIGSSQLSQSNFGENWAGKANGGGVPINSPSEYREIYEASRPMLVRTYAGTKNIPELAQMYERELNICWHALSFWWFNELDGRGPYHLYKNLIEHIKTLDVIAKTGKPFEANVSHHFSFRGGDDLSYIVSSFFAAKLAKKHKIKYYIAQNMLNTPKATWGIQDIAKSRAMMQLLRELEDENFKVVLQPRAGLDLFKPDEHEAKVQLAAVSAMMDELEPDRPESPGIIHVVSYSEASKLTNPEILKESIQITLNALKTYREQKRLGNIGTGKQEFIIEERKQKMLEQARSIIQAAEESIPNLYSPEGFYKLFVAGFMPVPYLWNRDEEYRFAYKPQTRMIGGAVETVDENGDILSLEERIAYAKDNLPEAEKQLKSHRPSYQDIR